MIMVHVSTCTLAGGQPVDPNDSDNCCYSVGLVAATGSK